MAAWSREDVEPGQLWYRKRPEGVYPRDDFVRLIAIVDQPAVILESGTGFRQTLVIGSPEFAEYRRIALEEPS